MTSIYVAGPRPPPRAASFAAVIALRLVLPIAAVAAVTYGLVRFVAYQAANLVAAEMTATAEAALAAAEAPVREATDLLAGLARTGNVGCTTLAGAHSGLGDWRAITGLALADQTGRVMCAASPANAAPAMAGQLLGHVTARMPTVTIQPDPRPDHRTILVAWGLQDGIRLIAAVDPALPSLPKGPALAEERLAITVALADGRPWRAAGHPVSGARTVARARSDLFPLVAEASIDADLLPSPFRAIATAVTALGAFAMAFILVAGGGQVRRRRPAARRTRAEVPPLRYQPVIRIDDGRMIGLDLVIDAPPGEPESVAGPRVLSAAMADAEPVLREERELKLSVGVDIEGPDFPQLVAVLRSRLQELSIEPRQLVLRLSPDSFGHPTVNDRVAQLRSTGCLLALDRFAAGQGGLVTMVRQKPDFLSIDGGLVAEVEESEEVTALVAAVVTMARSLRIGVVAHGIGSQAEVAALRRVGITSGTGPVFGPPLEAGLVSMLVKASTTPGNTPETVAA